MHSPHICSLSMLSIPIMPSVQIMHSVTTHAMHRIAQVMHRMRIIHIFGILDESSLSNGIFY